MTRPNAWRRPPVLVLLAGLGLLGLLTVAAAPEAPRPATRPVVFVARIEQEMRARVVEAEAEVPRAMAEAFRQGNLGIMDYYRMKNVQADTVMRESIAGAPEEPPGTQRK